MVAAYDQHTIEVVHRMKGERICHKDIAMSLGLSERQIRRLCASRKIKRPPPDRLHLPLGEKMFMSLYAEALRRKRPLPGLVHRLLTMIIKDNLFSAILDDK